MKLWTSILVLSLVGAHATISGSSSQQPAGVALRGHLTFNNGERQLLAKKRRGRKKNALCACVFGFDNVVYIPDNTLFAVPGGGGHLARDAKEVVNTCKDAGFQIGVASENCFTKEIQRILKDEVSSDIFTGRFFGSGAYQDCKLDKTPALTSVTTFYELRPECVIFFDVKGQSEEHSSAANVRLVGVDKKKGVTLKNMEAGISMLTDECGCKLDS